MTTAAEDLRCVSERELATLLGLTVSGLRKMRVAGTGPRSLRLGTRRIAYRVEDVKEWLLSRPTASGERGTVSLVRGGRERV